MSKKFFIILTVILILFLTGLVGYYFVLKSRQTGSEVGKPLTFKNFFPFGGDGSNTTGGEGTLPEDIRPVIDDGQKPPVNYDVKLRKVSTESTAGFGLFDSKLGTTLRYIERATGHIYEADLFSPKEERLSNTTLPKVYNAEWGSSSSTLIAQKLQDDNETIETYSLNLKLNTDPRDELSTSTKYSTVGTILVSNVGEVSTRGQNLFYIVNGENNSLGYISNINGTGSKQVWNSPIRELLVQNINNTTVAITTKPYPGVNGYLYFLNTPNGVVTKIIGNISGLSTLVSPDAKKVLVLSQSGSNKLTSYTISDRTSIDLNPSTFPEKCVWSKKDTNIVYCAVSKEIQGVTALTNWYLGSIQFNDDVWKYDMKANTANIVADLSGENGGAPIDVTKPTLSDNERYLVFMNKRDGSLWSLDLSK